MAGLPLTPPIKNILLDINGVLYNSGEDWPLDGSIHAMERLIEAKYNFCLVTNECTTARRLLAKKLFNLGFEMIRPEHIVSPGPVAAQYILNKGLVPRLHVWDGIIEDFKPVLSERESKERGLNCLVVGDVMTKLSRDFVDASLEMMLDSLEKPEVITLGGGRYYKDKKQIRMDTGAHAAAFCYALGIDKPTCLGKPSAEFFKEALRVVGGTPENTVMIGDDLISDVGGAQAVGMRGYLVRTGKYMPSDEIDQAVRPDGVFADLAEVIDKIIRDKPPFGINPS